MEKFLEIGLKRLGEKKIGWYFYIVKGYRARGAFGFPQHGELSK